MQISQTWVTQLQLEMLAAPAQSALLVSRSASQVRSRCYAFGSQSGVRFGLYPCRLLMEHLQGLPLCWHLAETLREHD